MELKGWIPHSISPQGSVCLRHIVQTSTVTALKHLCLRPYQSFHVLALFQSQLIWPRQASILLDFTGNIARGCTRSGAKLIFGHHL